MLKKLTVLSMVVNIKLTLFLGEIMCESSMVVQLMQQVKDLKRKLRNARRQLREAKAKLPKTKKSVFGVNRASY